MARTFVFGVVDSRGTLFPYTIKPYRHDAIKAFVEGRHTRATMPPPEYYSATLREYGARAVKYELIPAAAKEK